jgi:phosphoribosylamine--glycine ligase
MKVLVVGAGGREHAIIKALKKDPRITKLYAAPGNGGISRDSECVKIMATDIGSMTAFAEKNAIDYVVVAPDDPLAMGMVDALEEKGIRCFGPNRAAARIESSKVFSKALMIKYGIPTAAFESFDNYEKAREYVKNSSFPVWIKTDGLAFGKGAIQAKDIQAANNILKDLMVDKTFGESGTSVVIEEHMEGPEVTVLAFTDGKTIKPMVSSKDHKRALDGDMGLNTGGMGVIAPNPHYTDEIAAQCEKTIFLPTIRAMEKEGCLFKGCLYFGLMLTKNGPRVIEYNCRFGDPETQAVLSLLETNLLSIMEAVTDGNLGNIDIKWADSHAACLILASSGYPSSYKTGLPISGLDENGQREDAIIYHAGTEFRENGFYTAGGRVLGLTASAETLDSALEKVYKTAQKVSFEGVHYRKDIGRCH